MTENKTSKNGKHFHKTTKAVQILYFLYRCPVFETVMKAAVMWFLRRNIRT